MKTAISVPDPIFAEVEALAQQLGMSQSELYTANEITTFMRQYQRKTKNTPDPNYRTYAQKLEQKLSVCHLKNLMSC